MSRDPQGASATLIGAFATNSLAPAFPPAHNGNFLQRVLHVLLPVLLKCLTLNPQAKRHRAGCPHNAQRWVKWLALLPVAAPARKSDNRLI